MKLGELLRGIAKAPLEDIDITGIYSDSRKEMGAGSVFVCLVGKNFDAHSAIPELVEKGVSFFVTQRDCGIENQAVVEDTREALSRIWANWYGNPQKSLKMIGVTGTNGKTTVTTGIKKLLTAFGLQRNRRRGSSRRALDPRAGRILFAFKADGRRGVRLVRDGGDVAGT